MKSDDSNHAYTRQILLDCIKEYKHSIAGLNAGVIGSRLYYSNRWIDL